MSYSSDILTTSLSTPPKQQRSQHTSYDSVPNTPGTAFGMARVKYVKRKCPQADEDDENYAEDITPVVPKRGRPRRGAAETDESHIGDTTAVIPRKRRRPRQSTATHLQPVAPVAPVHPDTPSPQPRQRPAAFPSLTHEQPLYTHVSNHYGLPPRVGASTNKERKVWLKQVEAMYDNTAFPAEVDNEQRAWYEELNSRWLPGKVSTQRIEFRSLYTSLRATIIEQIREEFPQVDGLDWYYPVKTILGLDDMTLLAITNENDEAWDEIPTHLAKLKEEHPDDPIDPELPPQRRIVQAIRFLKQEHLPGSLLGKWQFPIPHVEEFIEPLIPSEEVFVPYKPETFAIQDIGNEDPANFYFENEWDTHIASIQRPHSHDPAILDEAYHGLPFHPRAGIVLPLKGYPWPDSEKTAINDMRQASGPDDDHTQRAPKQIQTIAPKNLEKYFKDPRGDESLNMRAKKDADRLWAEHQFNEPDLRIPPSFLLKETTSKYDGTIGMELLVFWKNAITRNLVGASSANTKYMFTPVYQQLKARETDLEHRIRVAYAQLNKFKKETTGNGPADGKFGTAAKTKEADARAAANSAAPKQADAKGARKTPKRRTYSSQRAQPVHQEPNNGFGQSTKIIPYQTTGASIAGMKRPAPTNGNAMQPSPKRPVMAPPYSPHPSYRTAPTPRTTPQPTPGPNGATPPNGTAMQSSFSYQPRTAPPTPHPSYHPTPPNGTATHPAPGTEHAAPTQHPSTRPYAYPPPGMASGYTAPHQSSGPAQGNGHVQQGAPQVPVDPQLLSMQGTQKNGAYTFGSAGIPMDVVPAKHEVNGKAENGAGVEENAGVEKNVGVEERDGVEDEKNDAEPKDVGHAEKFEMIPVPYS